MAPALKLTIETISSNLHATQPVPDTFVSAHRAGTPPVPVRACREGAGLRRGSGADPLAEVNQALQWAEHGSGGLTHAAIVP